MACWIWVRIRGRTKLGKKKKNRFAKISHLREKFFFFAGNAKISRKKQGNMRKNTEIMRVKNKRTSWIWLNVRGVTETQKDS